MYDHLSITQPNIEDKKQSSSPLPPSVHSTSSDPTSGDWRAATHVPPPPPAQVGGTGKRAESPSERKAQLHPYPMYPPYYIDPYSRYPMYPTMPPYGFHPAPTMGGRYVGRGGSKKHSERDREREDAKKHDFHPWDHTTEPVPRRKWNDDREQRPKILMKDKDWREIEQGDKPHPPDEKIPSESDHVPTNISSKVSDDIETDIQSSPLVPTMRSQQPKKIMLRKMTDNSKDSNEKEKVEGGKTSDRTSDTKSGNTSKTGMEQDSSEVAMGSSAAKPRQMAWKVTDSRASTTAKTLYEPEGKKSEAKFRKYQNDARGGGGSGHREKSGPSPATTPSDTQPPVHIPDVAGKDKLPVKRTYSGDRGRDVSDRNVGRRVRAGERYEDEDGHKWNEQRKNQHDSSGPQRDTSTRKDQHSGSDKDHHIKEQSKQHSKHPQQQKPRENPRPHSEGGSSRSIEQPTKQVEQTEHKDGRHLSGRASYDSSHSQERRGQGRRARSDRKSRGSETDDLREDTSRETQSVAKSRVPSVTDSKSVSRGEDRNKEPSVQQRRSHHGGVDQVQGKSDRRPNRTQRLPSKHDESKPKDDHKGPALKPSLEKKDLPSTAVPEATIMVPKTTVVTNTTTVPIVPASVPQTVINKSVSVQTSDHPPLELPLAYPPTTTISRPRPPLLQDPPQTLRKDYVDLRTNKKPRTMPEHHQKKQDRRRSSGPDVSRGESGNRGSRRGSQRGRGRDGDSLRQHTSTQPSAEIEGKGGSERGRSKRRDRIPELPEDHGKPLLREEHSVEQIRRSDSGRGRDRRHDRDRGSRRNDPPVRPPAKQQGSKPEQRVTGVRQNKGIGNKPPNFTPVVESKLPTGYVDLEDIESGSDWDEQDEPTSKKTEVETMKESHPRNHGRGQRIGIDPVESNRNDMRRSSGGRGRGRGGMQGGRPGSFKRGSGRPPQDTSETGHKPVSPEETLCHDDNQSEDQTVVHKQQEFAKYDLNSTTIAIVDDIAGQQQSEEIVSTVGFVEVTSKKTQKEKVKKEREEKWRLSSGGNESRDEQKKNRKSTAVRSTELSTSQVTLKPSTAWSSKAEDSSGTNIWSTTSTTAPSSDWGSSLNPMTSSTAPGAQLKETHTSWPAAMNVSSGVGVIGEGLQLRSVSTTLASQTESLPSAVEYSLFPEHPLSLISPTPYARGAGSGMLNAAVTMKISQEHLTSPSTESPPPGLGSHINKTDSKDENLTVVNIKETETVQQSSVKSELPLQQQSGHDSQPRTDEGHHSPLVGSDERKSSLPPRLQSSRSANTSSSAGCVGRGRGSTRGKKGERNKRVGGGPESERRDRDVPGESNRVISQHRDQRTKDKVWYR